jgi:hypothetical protein
MIIGGVIKEVFWSVVEQGIEKNCKIKAKLNDLTLNWEKV